MKTTKKFQLELSRTDTKGAANMKDFCQRGVKRSQGDCFEYGRFEWRQVRLEDLKKYSNKPDLIQVPFTGTSTRGGKVTNLPQKFPLSLFSVYRSKIKV